MKTVILYLTTMMGKALKQRKKLLKLQNQSYMR